MLRRQGARQRDRSLEQHLGPAVEGVVRAHRLGGLDPLVVVEEGRAERLLQQSGRSAGLCPGRQLGGWGVRHLQQVLVAVLVAAAPVLSARAAAAEDIRGVIARRMVLSEDARLVGDLTCRVEGASCIAFGAPGIQLDLNGFTITGLADASTGCGGAQVANEFGIGTNGQRGVEIGRAHV